MANILSPEAQRRLRAMNDVFGIEPEQIQEGLSPLEVGMIAPRTYDAFISAPTRSAIGSAIDGGNLADIGQAAAKQFGSDPELAPSFGFVEDVFADPLALPGVLSGATKLVPKVYSRLKALGEAGSADLGFYSRLKELIQEKMGGKATPEQIMSIARGGKAEEIADVGLEEFVKDKPKLSRAEVLDYLEKQSPTLTETVLKSPPINKDSKYLKLQSIRKLLEDANSPEEFEFLLKNDEKAYKSLMKSFPELEKKLEIKKSDIPGEWDVTENGRVIYSGSSRDEAMEYINEHQVWLDRNSTLFSEKVADDIFKDSKNYNKYPRYSRGYLNIPEGKKYKEILVQSAENPKAKDSEKRLNELYEISNNKNLTEAESNEMVGLERVLTGQESFAGKDVFRSQHWNEPNVLSHIRANERVDDAGRKSLHIEEIQSDWHQAGKKIGYKGKVQIPKPEELVAIRDPDFKRAGFRIETKDGEFVTNVFGDPVKRKTGESYGVKEWTPETAIQEAISRISESPGSIYPQSRYRQDTKMPNAPFKQSWVELSLKRAIKDAVDSGLDRITWTPGKLQADRYNLAKHVEEIAYNPKTKELLAYPKGTYSFQDAIRQKVSQEDLPKYLGEDKAKELLKTTPRSYGIETSEKKFHVLQNQDLEMGGEFHKKLYDEKIPNFLKNFGKKYDAKVGFTTINNGVKVPYFEITPELKKAVLSKGLPLYATPIALRLRALGDEDRK